MPDDTTRSPDAERVAAAAERARRHLAAVGAADLLADDPRPGVALPLWRGARFLLAGADAFYDRRRDLYWPGTPAGGIARSLYERHLRYGRPLW